MESLITQKNQTFSRSFFWQILFYSTNISETKLPFFIVSIMSEKFSSSSIVEAK